MNQRSRKWAAVLCTAGLAACGSDSDDNSSGGGPQLPAGEIRVIHASPDAPKVDVVLTEKAGNTSTTAIDDLDFAASSGYAAVTALTYDIDVQAVTPAGNVSVVGADGVAVAQNSRTTFIAVGTVAVEAPVDVPLEIIAVEDSASTPAANEVAIRVAHAASAAGSVDVYVTAPGDDLATSSPAITFDYKGNADAGAIPVGTYRIRITAAGSKTAVYDSGSVDLAPFAGQKLLISAVNTVTQTTSSASPVKLLVATDSATATLLSADTQAGVKVVHLSPDAGPVDVTVNGGVAIGAFDYLDIAQTSATGQSYIGLDAGTYDLNVNAPTGSGMPFFNPAFSAKLDAGMEYSVLAIGRASTAQLALAPTVDENRSIATQASVKVVHAAPDVGAVDVVAVVGGTDVTLLENVSFGAISDYLALSVPLTADIEIREAGSGAVVISVPGVSLNGGDVITAIAHQADEVAPIAPAAAGLILLSN